MCRCPLQLFLLLLVTLFGCSSSVSGHETQASATALRGSEASVQATHSTMPSTATAWALPVEFAVATVTTGRKAAAGREDQGGPRSLLAEDVQEANSGRWRVLNWLIAPQRWIRSA
eukprot:TRINITY_DN23828_c0_g3_i1.p2 TRINITY_DN23828_c0_g3~~TRINITY_DN23828_c0_g3_i1.p2  ORF type:complete len:116 (-),score=10.92 TRINITY_DN23828_c0_g3_i1:271-618(-)